MNPSADEPFVSMNRFFLSAIFSILVSGCSVLVPESSKRILPAVAPEADNVLAFSLSKNQAMPPEWAPLSILKNRKPTSYQLVRHESGIVLHARAQGASSALMHSLRVDVERKPWLQWQWKVKELQASDRRAPLERASPVRILLGFDGDKESLGFTEQIQFETAKLVTGHDFPYATLMYVWGDDAAPGTIFNSRHSSRIKMIVAENGPTGIGSWRRFSRNIANDFEKAFGERPGELIGIGVLTDAEESDPAIEAWYGDIVLSDTAPANVAQSLNTGSGLSRGKGQ